jgi:2',3'-cyclic-nucleotide 2'-phosphodiesterase/3'-nucleotidase
MNNKLSDMIKNPIQYIFGLLLIVLFSCSEGTKTVTILQTTDIHGVILPYDFIEKEKLDASMAGISTYLKDAGKENNTLILLDNGDNLQGQPAVYYYNFIDTVSPHLLAEAMNWLGYDAGTVGNHDIEAGHAVYDRLVKEYNFPLLAANAINTATGKPYFNPYVIIEKNKIKIAVMGLVTPAIPNWLPPQLYSGIEFRDMVESARLWMPEIIKQKPDLIVGLFHSGWNADESTYNQTGNLSEDEASSVAYNVPGFDIIFTGHDHKVANELFVNSEGDTLLILNGGSRSQNIARADIVLSSKKTNGKRNRKVSGKIINIKDYSPDPEFMNRFESQNTAILDYVNKVIGTSSATITSRDAYFGSSPFVDMIHAVQKEITGADISFAAPLSFDVSITKGPVTVGDMFKLYRFENMLYTMTLSGDEILRYLEYSYGVWINTMKKPDDHMLKYRLDKAGKPVITNGRAWLRNQSYNFDSATGIDYTVDVTKPEGSRITIKSFSDGRPFEKERMYRVAVNSYRGNGGGGLLTQGAGLTQDELRKRLVSSTERDLRYYILKSIESKKEVSPKSLNNWKLIPEDLAKTASIREYKMLFGTTK